MSGPFEVFELHQYRGMFCRHELLVRAARPASSNADQAMEDAADAFADSALLHLRTWWEGCRLPLDCRAKHKANRIGRVAGTPVGVALRGPGLRLIGVWSAHTADDPPLICLGTAENEDEFWQLVEESEELADLALRRPAQRRSVYLMTDRDGGGDLRDS